MKLGLLSAILDSWTYEEVIDLASNMGFKSVEMACWPKGKAERRYAGVSHIDAQKVLEDDVYAQSVVDYAKAKHVEISSLGYYPNPLDSNAEKAEVAIKHIETLIKASNKLGVGMVTTFIGRDQTKTVEDNLPLVKKIWTPILDLAEKENVKVAIENCPMLFGREQWPAGQNIFTSPENWKKVLDLLDSDKLGINFDPSHFIWQQLDYVKAVYDFKDKIFHVHFKDIKLYPDKLKQVGVMAYPLDYMSPKLPPYGDVDWSAFVGALTDIGYNGHAAIEIEDKAFEGSKEKILDSIKITKKYMENFVI
jgi:sugar phosphate isomerase/epimerase